MKNTWEVKFKESEVLPVGQHQSQSSELWTLLHIATHPVWTSRGPKNLQNTTYMKQYMIKLCGSHVFQAHLDLLWPWASPTTGHQTNWSIFSWKSTHFLTNVPYSFIQILFIWSLWLQRLIYILVLHTHGPLQSCSFPLE